MLYHKYISIITLLMFIILLLISNECVFAKEISIASYNVHFLYDSNKNQYDDPYTKDETRPSKSEKGYKALAEVIKTIDADIIALQEVESLGVLNEFNDKYLKEKRYKYIVLLEGNDEVGIDVALMSRYPVYSATSHKYMKIRNKEGNDISFARDFLVVKVRVGFSEPLYIGVVHLKSSYEGYKQNLKIRRLEVKMVKRIISDLYATNPKIKFILLGDFNDNRNSSVIKSIVKYKSKKTYLNYKSFIDLCDLDGLEKKKRYTYPSSRAKQQIDYIFASPDILAYYIKGSIKVIDDIPELENASDHLPIFCKFDFAKKNN